MSEVAVRPLVLLCPAPQDLHTIFTAAALDALRADFDVRLLEADDPAFDELLPDCFAVVGQPDLPGERLARAHRLRAVLNVEGNFYPNVDYPQCFDRGIQVLGCGPAYADAVAEYALGLALDLARGITRGDRLFRAGREEYVAAGNRDALLVRGSRIGLLGYGNLGRALVPLLAGFRPQLRVFDPWLPDGALVAAGLEPATLEEVLRGSDIVFVLASVTEENQQLLDAQRLALLSDGACLVLVSRAPIVDFAALRAEVGRGRIRAAIDVWLLEPMPPDEPLRTADAAVLSAHRAGGIPAAYASIGDMVLDDLRQIARGLPPARMQVAARELVGRYRNRPVQRQSPAS